VTRGQPLFRLLGLDGAEYLLVIESRERWTIHRGGEVIADGPTDDAGIANAIAAFRTLPVATPQRAIRPHR